MKHDGGQSKNSVRNKDPIDSVDQTEIWKYIFLSAYPHLPFILDFYQK